MRGISGRGLNRFLISEKGGWGWCACPPTFARCSVRKARRRALCLPSPKLVCDTLDRTSPDAERLGYLQDIAGLIFVCASVLTRMYSAARLFDIRYPLFALRITARICVNRDNPSQNSLAVLTASWMGISVCQPVIARLMPYP